MTGNERRDVERRGVPVFEVQLPEAFQPGQREPEIWQWRRVVSTERRRAYHDRFLFHHDFDRGRFERMFDRALRFDPPHHSSIFAFGPASPHTTPLALVDLSTMNHTRGTRRDAGLVGIRAWFVPEVEQRHAILDLFATHALKLFVFGYLGLSPDTVTWNMRQRIHMPLIVPDIADFLARDFDKEMVETIERIDPADPTAWRRRNLDDLVRTVRGHIWWVLRGAHEGLGDTPSTSTHPLHLSSRTSDLSNMWRYVLESDRVHMMVSGTLVEDDPPPRMSWNFRFLGKEFYGPRLAAALHEARVVADLDWLGGELDRYQDLLGGRGLIDLEPYFLLDSVPPPLWDLKRFRAFAGLPAV